MNTKMTGIIILAAGASTRLGRPKQNLLFRGKSLLQNAVEAAWECACGPVVVVTGANEGSLTPFAALADLLWVHNAKWRQGPGSSIKKGLEQLLTAYPSLDSIIITLCDQPFVTGSVLRELLVRYADSGKGIVASSFKNAFGPPVLFSSKYFTNLLAMSGSEGAKKLIFLFEEDLNFVEFPLGEVDVDTEDDYLNLGGISSGI